VNILNVKELKLPEVKAIRYGRIPDHRGYFTEHYRKNDFDNNPLTDFMKGIEFVQSNESFSRAGAIRGLHFQWNPMMGKLVRTLHGHMIDMVVDIRKGSPNFGRIIAYDMPVNVDEDYGELIWIPPGFAHGTLFPEASLIEYFCSGEYNGECEAGISPLASDLDWSLCERDLKESFDRIASRSPLITDRDRQGFTLAAWKEDPRSENFIY
jgi:dTDP-4-dehydrorhamnose 3,5-epimerase